jgi:enoyl-CoA hydratase/carnithine racemase
MYEVLGRTLNEAAIDTNIRVVLLNGNELISSAGNDLGDLVENPSDTTDAPVWKFLHALSAFPKPAIAAVCGAAAGIGTTMLLHCDLVFACDHAKFTLPFVNLGVCLEAASSWLLPRLAGCERAVCSGAYADVRRAVAVWHFVAKQSRMSPTAAVDLRTAS